MLPTSVTSPSPASTREHPAGVALGDHGGAVGQEVHAPRRLEAGGDRVDDLGRPAAGALGGSSVGEVVGVGAGSVAGSLGASACRSVSRVGGLVAALDEQAASATTRASGSAASVMPSTVAARRSISRPARGSSSSSACTSLGLLELR